jgi:hypothetical protein
MVSVLRHIRVRLPMSSPLTALIIFLLYNLTFFTWKTKINVPSMPLVHVPASVVAPSSILSKKQVLILDLLIPERKGHQVAIQSFRLVV